MKFNLKKIEQTDFGKEKTEESPQIKLDNFELNNLEYEDALKFDKNVYLLNLNSIKILQLIVKLMLNKQFEVFEVKNYIFHNLNAFDALFHQKKRIHLEPYLYIPKK